jgi:hypothetical protein
MTRNLNWSNFDYTTPSIKKKKKKKKKKNIENSTSIGTAPLS